MANTQGKHTVHRTQPASRVQASESTPQFVLPRRAYKVLQAKGKQVKEILFSSEPGYESISIHFQDKTALEFIIEAGFTLKPQLFPLEIRRTAHTS